MTRVEPLTHPLAAELAAAARPFVDACLKHPELQQFVPRLSEAIDAVNEHMLLGGPFVGPTKPLTAPVRESAATLAALADVDAGHPIAPSARKHGIQPSTLFRALKRRREAALSPPAG